ncbi:DUF3944 domain-containing protein [Pseudomonas sp. MAFF 311095]|uniref:DUF3944 domain-containing protein n=1 Tax=Pseudomonas petroselini TaxID=2899822 RepID=A0ABS8QQM7_9PSED|nr:DUF3944 domain-containing protein [Pseudomonas petroselini]MCD7037718.1 DUF3944 domain-containing protein [Pseudomonas petroselini]MCD7043704.1 DUF3944 domain-containing protein [Pseudomonas petroselini]MCD7069501.1 DUF3944 domain-containing protein [Pseudomonas petroselini]MCD7081373.1 DUF3944 domain-containing protein [Pseudomonas petroselini]
MAVMANCRLVAVAWKLDPSVLLNLYTDENIKEPAMAYREDPDLVFLSKLDSESLNDLVYTLIYDKDGDIRMTEELTTNDTYKRHNPDHNQYWDLIAAEIQCFGGNTFATMFRGGKGVLYREVLQDVCDKLKVNYNSNTSVEKIENNLLMKILTDAVESMDQDQIKELADSVGISNAGLLTPEAMVGVFQTVFRAGGFKSYQLTLIIVNTVLKHLIGRGLTLAANAALTRTMSVLMGPVGWAITGAWTAVDVASAAYRVTIPAVIQVAALRQKHSIGAMASQVSFG